MIEIYNTGEPPEILWPFYKPTSHKTETALIAGMYHERPVLVIEKKHIYS